VANFVLGGGREGTREQRANIKFFVMFRFVNKVLIFIAIFNTQIFRTKKIILF